MKRIISIKFYECLDVLKKKDLRALVRFIKEAFFLHSTIVVCVKNMTTELSNRLNKHEIKLVEISPEKANEFILKYLMKSRQHKARKYFANGYHCFAAIKNGKIVGDVWAVFKTDDNTPVEHKDFRWYGFQLKEDEAYMFDMFISQTMRGSGFANEILKFALNSLRQKGFFRVYGTYRSNNLPALWMHKILGYEDISKAKIYRFFNFRWSIPINS